jgi:hypothetical protein
VSIFSGALPRNRASRGLLATAAALALAVGALSVGADAQAAANRRICEYSFKVQPTTSNANNPVLANPLAQVSLGMNYKKDGACPTLNPQKLADTGYVDADQVNPKNSVNKWTCEDWGATHRTYFTRFGKDPCPEMEVDTIYAFVWQDPTTADAEWPVISNLGPYSKYV